MGVGGDSHLRAPASRRRGGGLALTYPTGAVPPGRARWPRRAPVPARPASAPCARALDSGAGTAGGSARGSAVLSRRVSAAEAKTPPRVGLPRPPGAEAPRGRDPARQPAGRGSASGMRTPGPRSKARTGCSDSQVVSHLLCFLPLAASRWPLALLSPRTSRCGVLRWQPWDQNPGPPVHS